MFSVILFGFPSIIVEECRTIFSDLIDEFHIFPVEDYQTLRNLLLELSLPERSCSIKSWKQIGEVLNVFLKET